MTIDKLIDFEPGVVGAADLDAPGSSLDWTLQRMSGEDRTLLIDDRRLSVRGTATDPCLLAVNSASGIWIHDHAGRQYMDLYGNNCHHVGYGHPRLVAALKKQLETLAFVPRGLTAAPVVAFAEALVKQLDRPRAKVVTARSGADAIETALAIARVNTGRYKTLSFYDSYHGRSAGALSVGGRHQDRHRLEPLLPGACHVPPYYQHGTRTSGASDEACARTSLASMRAVFEHEPDIGAVIGETIRNGPHMPPDWFWPEVRRLCDAHGALLILDEIATGLGKTGHLFNHRKFDVRPDILVLGKALGGTTLPMSAVVVDPELDSAPGLNIGYFTHEKNPLCARAGLEVLSILEDERLVENARTLGEHILSRLHELKGRHKIIAEIQGAGLMISLEFTGDVERSWRLAQLVSRGCIERGLLPTPQRGGSLTFSAPLIITRSEIDDAIAIIDQAIAAAETW